MPRRQIHDLTEVARTLDDLHDLTEVARTLEALDPLVEVVQRLAADRTDPAVAVAAVVVEDELVALARTAVSDDR